MTDTYSEQRAEETQAILTSCHAILSNDHFVYISGQHGSGWIDKDAIFVDPAHRAAGRATGGGGSGARGRNPLRPRDGGINRRANGRPMPWD